MELPVLHFPPIASCFIGWTTKKSLAPSSGHPPYIVKISLSVLFKQNRHSLFIFISVSRKFLTTLKKQIPFYWLFSHFILKFLHSTKNCHFLEQHALFVGKTLHILCSLVFSVLQPKILNVYTSSTVTAVRSLSLLSTLLFQSFSLLAFNLSVACDSF